MRAPLIALIVLAMVLAVVAVPLGGGGGVSADAGPHVENAGMVADGCAGCHRAHTGQAEFILRDAELSLCYSCHGTGGPGADTAVEDGKLYGAAETFSALKAGGFVSALIDTDDPSVPQVHGEPTPTGTITPVSIAALATPQPVTSNHSNDGSPQTLWGSGAVNTGVGGSFDLKCTSCHDPHGNGQFRILRPDPAGVGTPVPVSEEDPIDYDTDDYKDVSYVSKSEISSWCSNCHTRYLAPHDAHATPQPGEDIFKYRHASDGTSYRPGCVTCHVAHGTNAVTLDGGYSEGAELPGGTPGPGGDENSRLLRMDNRGICQKCHDK